MIPAAPELQIPGFNQLDKIVGHSVDLFCSD
jgi:hypothetical protein